MIARIASVLTLVMLAASAGSAADAPAPCEMPIAATLADRPGTGRTTSSGGAPCVVLPGDVVIETGVRRQITTSPGGRSVLVDGPLTFVRAGVAKRIEFGLVPPAYQSRTISGAPPFDAASGVSDLVFAAKVLVADTPLWQASAGLAYAPPSGRGEFTAGLPTYAFSANAGVALGPRFSLAVSNALGTATGIDERGVNRTFFVYAPSVTLAFAIDAATTLLLQDAFASRQGPLLPAGSRGFIALQHAAGDRLAFDIDYETNLASLNGPSHAFGIGLVWKAVRRR